MFSYFFVLVAVFTRILPHPWFSFTAVGASLLVFGARRSPKLFILPVLALAAADYYLTVFAYNFPFHLQDYWSRGHGIWVPAGWVMRFSGSGPMQVVSWAQRSPRPLRFSWQAILPSGLAPCSIRITQADLRPAISRDSRFTAMMFWQRPC